MEQQLYVLWVIEEEYLRANTNLFADNCDSFQKYSKQENSPFVLAEVQLIDREPYLYDLGHFYSLVLNLIRQSAYSNYLFCGKSGIPHFRPQVILFCDGRARQSIKELCYDDEKEYRYFVYDDCSKIDWPNFLSKPNDIFDPGCDLYGENISLTEPDRQDSEWSLDLDSFVVGVDECIKDSEYSMNLETISDGISKKEC